MSASPAVDPSEYAKRLDVTDELRRRVEALIAEAVLASHGRLVLWKRCQHCDKLFRTGNWPRIGYQRTDAKYCCKACYRRAKQHRHAERNRG